MAGGEVRFKDLERVAFDNTPWAFEGETATPTDYDLSGLSSTPSTGDCIGVTGPAALGWVSAGGGSGDVVGPGSAVDGDVVLFDGTTGKLIKDAGFLGSAVYRAGGTDVAVTDGGTGASTLTGVLIGHGTSAFTGVNTLTDNHPVRADGTGAVQDTANWTFADTTGAFVGSASMSGGNFLSATNTSTGASSTGAYFAATGATGATFGMVGASSSSDNAAYGGYFSRGSSLNVALCATGMDLVEMAEPDAPPTSFGRLYFKSTDSRLYYKTDGGAVYGPLDSGTGSGTVNNGTAGRLALYPATAAAVDDVYVQNTKNIDILIEAQASRSANLEITIPNPGNAVTTAIVPLTLTGGTDNHIARWDGTKMVQDSNWTLTDGGSLLWDDGTNAINLLPDGTEGIQFETSLSTSVVLSSDVYGVDSVARFALLTNGTMSWGDGSGAADTVLSRSAANVLALGAGDALVIGSTAGDHATTTDGLLSYDSTANRMKLRQNGAWVSLASTADLPKQNTYLTPCAGGLADSAAGTRTLTSGTTYCVYIGRASGAASALTIYYDLTGAFTLGAGQIGICKGTPPDQGNASLTYLGSATLSGAEFGLGAKKKAVTLTTNIAAGDELWACIYTTSSLAGTIHVSLPDLLAIGAGQSNASDFTATGGWSAQGTTTDGTTASVWLKARILW